MAAKHSISPLRVTRIISASVFIVGITLLFVGIGGQWWGWMVKLQFIPSIFRVIGGATLGNVAILACLLVLTLLFGRLYCSVICPLGIFQDFVIFLRKHIRKKRYVYSPERKWLRRGVLLLCIVSVFVVGQLLISLIAPYSAYGKIVHSLCLLATGADLPPVLAVSSGVMLALVCISSWMWGRAWCNTICPAGTLLGFFSRHSLFRVRIDTDACVSCGLCEKSCKSSCIDSKSHNVDYSRCIDCFDCLESCSKNAIRYGVKPSLKCSVPASGSTAKPETTSGPTAKSGAATDGMTRRNFIAGAVSFGGAVAASRVQSVAQNLKINSSLSALEAKQEPVRTARLVPPGSYGAENFYEHCTSCQLCVNACPNAVLKPSSDLQHFLQPVMSYTDGYCRPECTVCSELCPSGAIRPIHKEEKSGIKIGTAKVNLEICLAAKGEAACGNCSRHCPTGAILMVKSEELSAARNKIPVISESQCIGCGACEYLCPTRPVSAITVDGIQTHRKK